MNEGVFELDGWQFEVRTILVETGEVGGIYTIHVAPRAPAHFLLNNNHLRSNATLAGEEATTLGYEIPFDAAVPQFVEELIFEMKPWTRPSEEPG